MTQSFQIYVVNVSIPRIFNPIPTYVFQKKRVGVGVLSWNGKVWILVSTRSALRQKKTTQPWTWRCESTFPVDIRLSHQDCSFDVTVLSKYFISDLKLTITERRAFFRRIKYTISSTAVWKSWQRLNLPSMNCPQQEHSPADLGLIYQSSTHIHIWQPSHCL